MTIDIIINRPTYNLLKLDADLRATLANKIAGVSASGDRVTVHFLVAPTQAEIDTAHAIVNAHNASELTPEQEAAKRAVSVAAAAEGQVAAIPGWAHWTEQQVISYITANVTDLASAKTVLIAMARMMVALRNAQWPGLEGGG